MSLISLKNVTKQSNGVTDLKNINLNIDSNSKIGIKITPSASKTLFELISGNIPISSGSIVKNTDSIIYELQTDGFYDSFTVKKYIKLFKKISNADNKYLNYLQEFSIEDIWNTKIKNLSSDQKRRISLFRMFISAPSLILIESPLTNLTDEGIELYLKAVDFIRNFHITVLFTSYYMEELLLLSDEVYRYNDKLGLEKIDIAEEDDTTNDDSGEKFHPQNVFKVACKMADKTIFFSPDEIDFIESINSVSNIRIGDEYYPSSLTMNDLEEKLAHFGFYRCHRSYLVNLQRISELISYSRNSYTLILKGSNKEKLPLSRTKMEDLRKLIES
ncbi:LytTR family transcriptional regulator DNA-binding domain-containing protein [Companilactobacillus jidongensis]|uniref:LytTR family transcriptional regulator DNA-binding domain-containing protein n=1 Tax=Companilactobacillus jidongensis TaxID=2486006 RepID=UPI000F79492E|nr:LytTR family transcriptional regulator DNA-binding domain-containing protein [Companilactobacillus jidongensis]